MTPPSRTIARVLVVAGSDSGGGAGIQADIKTITMLGGHAMTAVTAITAQNTIGVQAVMPVPAEMVVAQMQSCIDDIGVDAVKIGMLGSAETAHAVADVLATLDVPVVFDPVMVATSGDRLADVKTIAVFKRLIALSTVTTPNQDELVALSGILDRSDLGVFEAAGGLAERHSTAILVTGTIIGDGVTWENTASGSRNKRSTGDFLYDRLFASNSEAGFSEWEWPGERIDTQDTHGTGCTLASGIATGLAQGMTLPDAIMRARLFVRAVLKHPPRLGHGQGPMGHNLGIAVFDELTV